MTPLRRLLFSIIAPVAVALIRLMWATYRFEVRENQKLRELVAQNQQLILSFWHDSIFICAWYLMLLSRQGLKVTYLVSPSADGELAVRMLSVIGGCAVRGSATRSGVKAMHGMYRAMARDHASPVIVPDGPQGPAHYCKLGSVMLAQLSGAPMVPIGCAARSVWRLRTWDRLQIPRPFSRVVITIGAPTNVQSRITDEQREQYREELEKDLEAAVAEAEQLCGSPTADR